MKSETKKVLVWVVGVVLALALIGWVVWSVFIAQPNIHAVSLTSGEVYFGELQRFPTFGLKHVYTLQVNPQNQQQPLSIQKFDNVFWGPEDFLEINRDNVVWMAELTDQSQLAQIINNNPDLLPSQQGSQIPGGTVPAEGDQVPGPSGAMMDDGESMQPGN